MSGLDIWARAEGALKRSNPIAARGLVTDMTGLIIEGNGPAVGVGSTCSIVQGDKNMYAQVVGFRKDRILLMPFGEAHGIAPGAVIISHGQGQKFLASKSLLGRVIDPFGNPLDGGPPVTEGEEVPLFASPPAPLERERIRKPFDLG